MHQEMILKGVVWVWRGVLFVGVVVFFFWIANEAFSFDGDTSYRVVPGEPNPFVGFFHPSARVGNPFKDEKGNTVQRVYEDPVYFEVKSIADQSYATIRISAVNATQGVVMAGVKGNDGQYRVYPFSPERRADGVWSMEAQVPLADASHEKGKYWFSLSVAGLQRGNDEYWELHDMGVGLSGGGIEDSNFEELARRAIKKIL